MRCLDMHMSAVNNPDSIGHVPQKELVLGSGQSGHPFKVKQTD